MGCGAGRVVTTGHGGSDEQHAARVGNTGRGGGCLLCLLFAVAVTAAGVNQAGSHHLGGAEG